MTRHRETSCVVRSTYGGVTCPPAATRRGQQVWATSVVNTTASWIPVRDSVQGRSLVQSITPRGLSIWPGEWMRGSSDCPSKRPQVGVAMQAKVGKGGSAKGHLSFWRSPDISSKIFEPAARPQVFLQWICCFRVHSKSRIESHPT